MPELSNPLVTARIKLPYNLYVRVQVWSDLSALRENTREHEPAADQVALFVAANGGSCIGTINFAATHISNGTRAHEIMHMMEHFRYRAWDEKYAQLADHVTTEVDIALVSAGIL